MENRHKVAVKLIGNRRAYGLKLARMFMGVPDDHMHFFEPAIKNLYIDGLKV